MPTRCAAVRRRGSPARRPRLAISHDHSRESGHAEHGRKAVAGKHEKYQRLLAWCKTLPPTLTAVAHPCDDSSLQGAIDAAQMGLIAPLLVGPRARIEAVAQEHGLDLAGLPIEDTVDSHASAARAVELVRTGKAEAVMKGSLHTDELMSAVVQRDTGLRTARRVSHCFIMDVPSHAETLILTDAAVNIAPTLEEKVDIIQNAIDLAHVLRFQEVLVAILSAMETVNPRVPSTVEAAALCKMADRQQITGAILDGRSPSTMRSALHRSRSSTSIRPSQGAPTCWSCRTSKPVTCSRKASRFSQVPMLPGSCWARACRLFSRAARMR